MSFGAWPWLLASHMCLVSHGHAALAELTHASHDVDDARTCVSSACPFGIDEFHADEVSLLQAINLAAHRLGRAGVVSSSKKKLARVSDERDPCHFRKGAVLEDQICKNDELYKEIDAFAAANCSDYFAANRSGKEVPSWVVRDGKCLEAAFQPDCGIPNWVSLGFGARHLRCRVELSWDVARNDYTRFADLRGEHIALFLIRDSDPKKRLNFARNRVSNEVISGAGDALSFGLKDVEYHLKELMATRPSDAAIFATGLWNHLITFAVEVFVLQGSGALAILKTLTAFVKESVASKVLARYIRCKADSSQAFQSLSEQGADGAAVISSSSFAEPTSPEVEEDAILATLGKAMPNELFKALIRLSKQLQDVVRGKIVLNLNPGL